MIENMKQSSVGVVVVLVAALVVSIQGIAASDPVMADSAVLGDSSNQPASRRGDRYPKPTSTCRAVNGCFLCRRWDIPSISGRYAIGGRTLLPYIGAGFLEATVQNSIVPWVGHLPCSAILGFEVSLDRTFPRMSSN